MEEIKTTYLVPVRIVCEKNTEHAEVLLRKNPRQAILGTVETALIPDGGYLVLDFGRELQGGLEYTVQTTEPAETRLRLTFGESVSEALSSIGEKNATNDHAPRDFEVPLSFLSTQQAGKTGFRFVKLEAKGGTVTLSSVRAASMLRDIPYRGSFRSNDERLNKIWEVGAYTVHLNMQEYLWDGIKRDRLVWIGDMHPETSTITSVFGDASCVPKSLDLVRDQTPCDQWMNTIATYSMWWIINHHDWYLQNGNLSYLKEQKDYLLPLIEKIISVVREDGTNTIEDKFVDWSSRFSVYADAGVTAILKLCLDDAAFLCCTLGEADLAEKCRKTAEKLSCYHPDYSGNKQMAALMSLSGLADAKAVNRELLSGDLLSGLSTFMGYYVLLAKAKAQDAKGALDIIRGFWGAMLDLGATTFWEDFDIAWIPNAAPIDEPVPPGKKDIHGDFGKHCYQQLRHSLCHGWASGPTAFLSKKVLGITILEPGCKRIKITPMLGDLEWVTGDYPTPYGNIHVEHRVVDGKVVSKIEKPAEIAIEV